MRYDPKVARRYTGMAGAATIGAAAVSGCVALLGTDDVGYRGAAEGGASDGAAPGDGSSAETGTEGGVEGGTPAPVASPSTLAVGMWHACAIANGGRVFCWGQNDLGQLGVEDAGEICDGGYGPAACARRPLEVPLGAVDASVVELAAGRDHGCARFSNGRVYCWPGPGIIRVLRLDDAVRIAATVSTNFAIHDGGQLVGWGRDDYSELGDDRATGFSIDPLALDAGAVDWVQGGPGASSACAGARDGRAVCWGDNRSGQIAMPITTFDAGPNPARSCAQSGLGCVPSPRALDLGRPIAAVSLNQSSGCAALLDGTVKCFGTDNSGNLGARGTPGTPVLPVDVSLPLGALAVGVASAYDYSCARLQDGRVMCWGFGFGLARGINVGTYPPLEALLDDGGVLSGVEELQASDYFACARRKGGEVVCWGQNDYGELGDPSSSGLYARRVPLP
jgi:alpha-tubulin suppressor-like RCC1 family protein